jgi:preprotein translocase subunit SecE
MTQTEEPKKRTGAVKKPKDETEEKKSEENSLMRYLRETRGELRKVTWPTRDEAMRLTAIVLAFTAVFAIFLGLVDLGWSTILEQLVRLIVGA